MKWNGQISSLSVSPAHLIHQLGQGTWFLWLSCVAAVRHFRSV